MPTCAPPCLRLCKAPPIILLGFGKSQRNRADSISSVFKDTSGGLNISYMTILKLPTLYAHKALICPLFSKLRILCIEMIAESLRI